MPPNTDNYGLCQLALVVLLLPLVGFVIQVFLGTKIPPRRRQGDWIPTGAMFAALLIACYMMLELLGAPNGIEAQRWYPLAGQGWIDAGGATASPGTGAFQMHFSILVDNLTIVMLFVVTLVSFLVHLYSWGYMHGEVRYNRFFAYLALFSFSMLGLCITNNLLFLFIFWELVGVCSYFLIGFYFEKKSAQHASIKAFVTTRVGDLGFFAAILIIAAKVGSLEFNEIFASVARGDWGDPLDLGFIIVPAITFTGICLFFGPIGKSAQFPLHIWLPDAMEGPTPVSALIHAATMVAAGVYLIGRMFPFMAGQAYFSGDFFQSDALFFVALVGGITAFFAATIAFAQNDIKKVLAYSTVSQLGYMMLALGVGSLSAGLFHLTTHAFFKALLFLGSGSVIHAVHSNEMTDMGGLSKKMKVTWVTFGIGTLAIAGLPFLSGFYSKEAILTNAYAFAEHSSSSWAVAAPWLKWAPFVLGTVTAGMTAFYMFRLFFKTFHGKPQNEKAYEHAHESPWTMTVPLGVLAFLSVVAGGIVGTGTSTWFAERVSSPLLVPVTDTADAAYRTVAETAHHVHSTMTYISIGLFAGAVFLAALFFLPQGPFYGRNVVGGLLAPIYRGCKNLWYVDQLLTGLALWILHTFRRICGVFDNSVVDGFVNFWGKLCRFVTAVTGSVDYHGVDGTVRGLGETTLRAGLRLRRLQTGYLQEYVYASVFLFAGIVFIASLIWILST